MSHPLVHPPTPSGATGRELTVLHRLHRAAATIHDHERRPAMIDAMALLVEVIEARERRRSFADRWDHDQSEG